MQRLSSALAGAAVSLAILVSSGHAQATPLRPAIPIAGGGQSGSVQLVGERGWGHRGGWGHHGGFGHHGLNFGLGFALGAAIAGSPYGAYPYDAYPYGYTYRRPGCPYGSFYEPGYGCVVEAYEYPSYPIYGYGYRWRHPLEYREHND